MRMLPALLLPLLMLPPTFAPHPAVPLEPTSAILAAFRDHRLVAIGDAHGDVQGEAFQLALIRNPRFAETVNDILIEVGNSRYQEVVDRYVGGADVPKATLQRVWLDTTQQHVASLQVPEIVRAVRDININATLPRDRQLRVLVGEPPIDWEAIKTREDLQKWEADPASSRDRFAVGLIQREVLAKGRRALAVYGAGHFFRKVADQSMVTLLEASNTKVFTVWTNAAAELSKMQPDVTTWPTPSLTLVRDTTLGQVGLSEYLGPNAGDVSPEWLAPMQDQFDAVLYLGPLASLKLTRPPAWPCAEPALPERLRRLALRAPALADRIKQTCVP
jgi:hypothetical protein